VWRGKGFGLRLTFCRVRGQMHGACATCWDLEREIERLRYGRGGGLGGVRYVSDGSGPYAVDQRTGARVLSKFQYADRYA
jgi:hypothetical protein